MSPTQRSEHAGHDAYFSVDIETDGPIPGPYSMLSFALVRVGFSDGRQLRRCEPMPSLELELQPISERFEEAALQVSGLDRERLVREGLSPSAAMEQAAQWVRAQAAGATPVLVAFPLSFDWSFLYWYFVQYAASGSPFRHSHAYDLKTAFAVKARRPICEASRSQLPEALRSSRPHTHRALDDALEQADIFAQLFSWNGA